MSKHLSKLWLLLSLLLSACLQVGAQTKTAYTSTNKILITLDGIERPYTYASDQLLVRYNRNTQKLECILNLATLYPINKTVPPALAYDVLFGAKYPELLIEIEAPVSKINAGNLYAETLQKKTQISLQGVTNRTVIPITFTPDRNGLFFSTSFELMLDNFQASIPAQYYPLLTGRVVISVTNAQWADIEPR